MNKDSLIYMLCAILVLCATIWFVLLMTETEESRIEPFVIEARAEKLTPLSQIETIVIETETAETAEEAETTTEETTEVETETEVEPIEIWTEYNSGEPCTISAYCLCRKCCGKNWEKNRTASGDTPQRYITVANGKLPFGTRIYIDGIGYRIVQDRGSGVGKNHFDIYCGVQNHEIAKEFGIKKRKVWIITEE